MHIEIILDLFWVSLLIKREIYTTLFANLIYRLLIKVVYFIEQGLKIIGRPCMTAFAVMSSDPNLNIMAVADVMETKGFKMERQQLPNSIHFSMIPSHATIVEKLSEGFRDAVKQVKVGLSCIIYSKQLKT